MVTLVTLGAACDKRRLQSRDNDVILLLVIAAAAALSSVSADVNVHDLYASDVRR